ncbi:MAG: hypothetical protein MUO77_13025, partial [Anaerolineales bacterium]|nr:hypothetical protein [Anaerolineales bacterium]
QTFTVNYGYKNQGDAASGPFTFRVKFHAIAGLADCNVDVDQLNPGQIVWGGCVRQINGDAGNYPVRAIVDVEGEIAESDEGNNEISTQITVAE